MSAHSDDLAALLGSRICHDLISPIGAIGNGLELISMSAAGGSPEMALVSESVANAQARIKFFRIAYGAVGDAQALASRDVSDILNGIFGGSRLSIDWHAEGELRRDEAKMVFLLIQCLESAMPYGGAITVARQGNTWAVSGTGRKFRDLAPLWGHLVNQADMADLTPAQIHFALAREHAAATERTLTLNKGETRIDLKF